MPTSTYFTGTACSKGHYAERYTSNGVCLECAKLDYKPTGKKVGNQGCIEKEIAIENGELFYFTGKPCKHGHIANRCVKTSACVECKTTVFKHARQKRERKYSITKYGITKEKYEEMLFIQNGVCRICKEPEKSLNGKGTGLKPLAIDHCHETGEVRGLLCSRCNIGIGSLKHSPDLLRKAALYCEEYKCTNR